MPSVLPRTPREDGFGMPAEWEPHDGCYLVWPERPDAWRNGGKPAQAAWVRLAEAIGSGEPGAVGGGGAGDRGGVGATVAQRPRPPAGVRPGRRGNHGRRLGARQRSLVRGR